MDKQRKAADLEETRTGLGWLDKALIKNGSLVLSALAIVIPLYARFVSMEQRMHELQRSVEKLTITVTALHDELAAEKSTSALLSLRLSYLEQANKQPGLMKNEAGYEP